VMTPRLTEMSTVKESTVDTNKAFKMGPALYATVRCRT
jgi:hypothetical protein